MTVDNITINKISIWLTIDQLRMYSTDRSIIENKKEYLCYFKYSEPTQIFLGELLRDVDKRPMLFESVDIARDYAIKELTNRLT